MVAHQVETTEVVERHAAPSGSHISRHEQRPRLTLAAVA